MPPFTRVNRIRHQQRHVRLTSCLTGHENVNKWFQSGDQAYIIVASAMVLVMVPGLGFLYSGLARRKSALSMMWACMAAGTVITFQWYFWGYSLTFSPTGQSGFIGDLAHFGLKRTLANPSPGSPLIPALLYAFYQVSRSSQHFFQLDLKLYPRCNSAPSQRPSPLVQSPNGAVSSPPWFGSSAGRLLYTILSPAGPGTPTAGASSMA